MQDYCVSITVASGVHKSHHKTGIGAAILAPCQEKGRCNVGIKSSFCYNVLKGALLLLLLLLQIISCSISSPTVVTNLARIMPGEKNNGMQCSSSRRGNRVDTAQTK